MKMTRLLLITIFLVSSLLQPNTFAQNYTKWGLPDGVTARLGKGYIRGMAFSPDGIRLAVASSIGVWIYDVRAGNEKELDLLTADLWNPTSVAYSPDGTTLAGGSSDDTVRLWDARTGEYMTALTGHRSSVLAVEFSPDGTTLATGSIDGTIFLWKKLR